jgi:hypothetical protein
MNRRRKSFEQLKTPTLLTAGEPTARVKLPGAEQAHCADLSAWLARGIDAWVLTCTAQLQAFVDNKTVSLSSVAAFGKALRYYFEYLHTGIAVAPPATPAALRPNNVASFVTWLASHPRLAKVSQRNVYTHVKSVLVALQDRGEIADDKELFPRNPFADASGAKKGSTPLSLTERSRLADALRRDIIELHMGRFQASESQALTVYALALAMRTGLNTSPLLELCRDCLQPHPFMPRMRLMRAYKRRGNATHIKTLRYQRDVAMPAAIPLDGAALFEEVLRRTEPLLRQAPTKWANKVWLYRSTAQVNAGRICCLTEGALGYNIRTFVQRHALLANDGSALTLNTSRLRKTMENRLWRLSNGDLFTVAALMGHTPAVAEQSYLRVTDDMRRNAAFVGEALADTYRGTQPTRLEPTPVGNCVDTVRGHRAPGDGTHCTDFLSCLGCRSFAIVGSKQDLHRLFSFYWFLHAESRAARGSDWTEHFLLLRTQIDAFTLDKFDEALVEQAKEEARVRPLKFWSQYARMPGRTHDIE